MFSRHMPHVCHAAKISGDTVAPLPAAAACLTMVNLLVDSQVRLSLVPDESPLALSEPILSPYQHWMQALQSSDPRVYLPREIALAWHEHLTSWRERANRLQALPTRLIFHVFEPPVGAEDDADQWEVSLFIEDKTDPSSRLPITVLDTLGDDIIPAYATVTPPQRMEMIQHAVSLCTHLPSPREENDSVFALSTEDVIAFLEENAPILLGAGFGVYFPTWWEDAHQKRVLTLRAQVRPRADDSEGPLSLTALVDFDWEVALGDETLTFLELEMLAAQKVTLVRFRGRFIKLDHNTLQSGVSAIKRRRKATVLQLLQDILDINEPQSATFREEIEPQGSIVDLVRFLRGHATLQDVAQPPGFKLPLRAYQLRGFSWLHFLTRHNLGCLLADEMGVGKTPQALALILHLRQQPRSGPVLVVTTTSSVENWRQEALTFCDLVPLIHHGQNRLRDEAFARKVHQHGFVITSYQILVRDVEHLREIPWQGIIIDEAQQVKNLATRQSHAIRSLTAKCRIALTGTPIENGVEDIFAIMAFLNPGLLGSQEQFRRQFVLPIQRGDEDAKAHLTRVLAPLILRRLKGDAEIAPELPPKIEQLEYCSLTKEQAAIYAAILQEMEQSLPDLGGLARQRKIFQTISRLKQCCNHPAHILKDNSPLAGRSGKLERLEELLADALATDQRILIFTQFAEWGRRLQPYLAERFHEEVLFFEGKTSAKQRTAMIHRFEHDPQGPHIFILTLKAGGTAINLVRAASVIHYDRWWNPAVEKQATDRAHRIGQKQSVHVHTLVCSGTLEQKIDAVLLGKQRLADDIILTGEADFGKLSTDQLRELLTLQKEALTTMEPAMVDEA